MRNISKIVFLVVTLAVFGISQLHAEKSRYVIPKAAQPRSIGTCLPASNSNELTINNVRAYLETNGTMWFIETAEYEVPKGSGKTSMFCAALWIGGRDVNQQLKLAAVRFRQNGDDFWTGPLSTIDATISQQTCIEYDRFFKITRAEVEAHIANWERPDYTMPSIIRNWPAHGDVSLGQSMFLAPYFDGNGNKKYEPDLGDYPYYDLENELCPWTAENKELAIAGQLPKTPEESAGISTGMVYADHVLKGDETLFWVFNDKGNTHTETGGEPIGLEIRGQAFAFATNDELNNMTFYSYEIINRSTYELTNTYFSQWVDPDLGYSKDDYVGCDVSRGLGYCFNGKDVDGQGEIFAYGSQPPAVGVDFFQGPYIDPEPENMYDRPKFNIDSVSYPGYCEKYVNHEYNQMSINGVNFGDGIPNNERFGMRRFVYHNNDNSVVGDPSVAYEYYNMLQAIWKDNTRMRYGANGHPSNGANGPECDFMFPGLTDPCNWGTKGIDPNPLQYSEDGWTEPGVGNAPEDRRFMQSAGPFTLKAGAVNYITVGIPWARASSGGAWASVELLKTADDKCQALFENCFKVLDGPDAPDVTVRELENQLILYLSNDDPLSNNHNEGYNENDNQILAEREIITEVEIQDTNWITVGAVDTFIVETKTVKQITTVDNDRTYRFEGYQIYQLKNKDVSVTDLNNADLARLVRQCDIENYKENGSGIARLVNWTYDDVAGTSVAKPMVDGANAGISHSFPITEDAFATGSNRILVNHKVYYFMVIAYAHNEYFPFSLDNGAEGLTGQKTPYLAGRKNIKVYSGIPHSPAPQSEGTILNAQYGTQPMITRIEGQGNGGFFLDLVDEDREKILKENTVQQITYKNNYGPLNIKVIDPLQVKPFDYEIKFVELGAKDVTDSTYWVMTIVNATDEEIIAAGAYTEDAHGVKTAIREYRSAVPISQKNEQLILSLGISISILDYGFQVHQSEIADWVNNNSSWTYANKARYAQVDFLGSSITYADESKPWFAGVPDSEGNNQSNWIRSGLQTAGAWQALSSADQGVKDVYSQWKTEDIFMVVKDTNLNAGGWESRVWKDPEGQFEGVLGGTWAPYVLSSPYDGGPQAKYINPETDGVTEPTPAYFNFKDPSSFAVGGPGYNQTMTNLYSVDIVLTSDKDKWTRCVVLEACEDRTLSEGGALKHEPRKAPSVDKYGNTDINNPVASNDPNSPNYISATGMGWFPGYAVNVETGERLNLMFSENSSDGDNKGNDMLFNPTGIYGYFIGQWNGNDTVMPLNQVSFNSLYPPPVNANYELKLAWGGMHFVFVCNSAGNTASTYYKVASANKERNYNDNNLTTYSQGYTHGGTIADGKSYYECGPYDQGQWLLAKFNTFVGEGTGTAKVQMQKMQLFNNVMWTSIAMPASGQEDNWLSNNAILKLRVSRPYMRYSSRWFDDPNQSGAAGSNSGYPMYSFTTRNIAPTTQATSQHDQILEDINIVPNPYYGFSTYESTALETYVKIVNLPEKCTISIFTVNGLLVRKITKGDEGTTHVAWNLKNNANVPIASGMYIIHVNAPGIGERTLKFFCAMRPTDLNAF
ncbi:MAG: T9SS type A sorting domain-containing protein [Bacteroidales bacterium]|jgi:hypothetical protein|nr:T9SS type A sorting domain-containing protein [Bacteroidales bacterium]